MRTVLFAALVASTSACTLLIDANTGLKCDADHVCPGGYRCIDNRCKSSGPVCGDYVIDRDRGEECDDGPANNLRGPCSTQCKVVACGKLGEGCCGSGLTCAANIVCLDGACSCPSGNGDCGGVCRDFATDVNNCGGCDILCPAGASCKVSSCVCPEPALTCSATPSVCVSALASDTCGYCSHVCASGATCEGPGVCTCPSGAAATVMAGSNPSALVAADFDGDGKLDLAIVNNTVAGAVTVLLGNGDRTFRTGPTAIVGRFPGAIAAGDLNRDNLVDLVVADRLDNDVRILLNTGASNGSFRAGTVQNVGSPPIGVALGRMSADAVPDVVIIFDRVAVVTVLVSSGSGGYIMSQSQSLPAFPVALALGDVDGDTKTDVVVALVDSSIAILRGRGDGTLQSALVQSVLAQPSALALADIDGDGRAEIFWGGATRMGVVHVGATGSVIEGNGSVSVARPCSALAVADVTGDGKKDLVCADTLGSTITVYPGADGSALSVTTAVPVGQAPTAVLAVDLDNAGAPELVTTNSLDGTITVIPAECRTSP